MLLVSICSTALAQSNQTGVVYDVFMGTVLSTFNAGPDARGAVWTSSATAFVANGQALLRVDLRDPGLPVVTATVSPFFSGAGGVPGPIFANAAGTRVFVPGVVNDGVASGLVYDVARNPPRRIAEIPTTGMMSAGAIFPGGTTAIFPAGPNLVFANLTADPAYSSSGYPFVASSTTPVSLSGQAAAVIDTPTDTATVAVSLRDGGLQLVNILQFPPVSRGPVVRPTGCTSSPGIVFIPTSAYSDRTFAITCLGETNRVVLIDVEGGMSAIALSTDLPAAFDNMRGAIAVHPTSGDLYVGGNGVVGVLGSANSWRLSTTISLGRPIIVDRGGVAVSPDGRLLLIVGHN